MVERSFFAPVVLCGNLKSTDTYLFHVGACTREYTRQGNKFGLKCVHLNGAGYLFHHFLLAWDVHRNRGLLNSCESSCSSGSGIDEDAVYRGCSLC